jgi:hypothetical protein
MGLNAICRICLCNAGIGTNSSQLTEGGKFTTKINLKNER